MNPIREVAEVLSDRITAVHEFALKSTETEWLDLLSRRITWLIYVAALNSGAIIGLLIVLAVTR